MYDAVLVPVDGSDHALAAARHALGLAETYGATVHGLYVVDTGTSWLTVSKNEVREGLREVGEAEAEQALSDLEAVAADYDADLSTELREGDPDEEILAAADAHEVDLVVMGTHGREGLRRRLVGSVAERVVREADPPVMTVTAGGD
ncbi:universal stress protein [Halorarius halobius]|uniref:universal stress protein n=1 Tax=Halorarius halobius TaxID=2962671 RepID=UPI0020CDDDE2|nr:universal stress protein [Halorarius halobius]